MPAIRIRFPYQDYKSFSEAAPHRWGLLNGDPVVAPVPSVRYRGGSGSLYEALYRFVCRHNLGWVFYLTETGLALQATYREGEPLRAPVLPGLEISL